MYNTDDGQKSPLHHLCRYRTVIWSCTMVILTEFLQDLNSQCKLDRPTCHGDGENWLVIAGPVHRIFGYYCCNYSSGKVAQLKQRCGQPCTAAIRHVLSIRQELVPYMAYHVQCCKFINNPNGFSLTSLRRIRSKTCLLDSGVVRPWRLRRMSTMAWCSLITPATSNFLTTMSV